ncbi:2-isopropylmalate_synthase [Hexamita inflata]|uniref:2-isopropylmalate synthase n=1 Tax=Hexamita inflata TaxID=28002 RepID=A0AA86TYB9_9EUKA|nr:2-isopropylmalate synthase [Hexamita inflata]
MSDQVPVEQEIVIDCKEKKFDDCVFYGELNENNEMHGYGQLCFFNGDECVGQFQNDHIHGYATLTTQHYKYTGSFISGQRTGKGRMEWPDGDVYEGSFLNGVFDGEGTMKWGNKCVHSGLYQNGDKCGFGTFVHADKTVFEGNYQNNLRNGSGKFTFTNGNYFTGEFVNNQLLSGVMVFGSGKECKFELSQEIVEIENANQFIYDSVVGKLMKEEITIEELNENEKKMVFCE